MKRRTIIDKITNRRIQLLFSKFRSVFLGNEREKREKKTFTTAQPDLFHKHAPYH